MQKNISSVMAALIILIFLARASSALAVKSVDAPNLFPGQEGELRVEVKNTLDQQIQDVSFSLDFTGLPLSSLGSSEDVLDNLNGDEDDSFSFDIRASSTAEPQDYKVPYTLTYKGQATPMKGVVTIRVIGNVELNVFASTKTPVVSSSDELTIQITNTGFADARYVSVQLFPAGFFLLSDDNVYIGDISSDDFQTAVFNIKYTSETPTAEAIIEYLDFNNQKQTMVFKQNIELYTQKEAINAGIISTNNTGIYITGLVLIILIWIIWRAIRKRLRKRRSMQRESSA